MPALPPWVKPSQEPAGAANVQPNVTAPCVVSARVTRRATAINCHTHQQNPGIPSINPYVPAQTVASTPDVDTNVQAATVASALDVKSTIPDSMMASGPDVNPEMS